MAQDYHIKNPARGGGNAQYTVKTPKIGGGINGTAALFAAAGLYLIYAGIKNVGFFEGVRSLLRQERPVSKAPTPVSATDVAAGGTGGSEGADKGIDKLIGNAKAAYPKVKSSFPGLTVYGWRSVGSVPNSDHPKGLALDVMNPTGAQANAIILLFRSLPGAHYWIWSGHKASTESGWKVGIYTGPNPHTDHVHLSFK